MNVEAGHRGPPASFVPQAPVFVPGAEVRCHGPVLRLPLPLS